MNKRPFAQDWKAGLGAPMRSIAVLDLEPDDFASRGVRFETDFDNLDTLRWAPVSVGNSLFVLVRHDHAPVGGTQLLAPQGADVGRSIGIFSSAFGFDVQRDVSWVLQTNGVAHVPTPKSQTPARDAVIVKYLNEAYGKEKQLETALTAQIALAKRPQLKKGLQDHLKVTKAQSKGLAQRMKQLGGKADASSDLPGPEALTGAVANVANRAIAGAKGPIQALRGTSEADNELRNVRDCLWNEAEEIAHYDVIETVAGELGDRDTVKLARTYRRQEEAMQKLLQRQLAPLVKAIVREEVPTEERGSSSRRSASSSRKSTSGRKSSSAARKTTSKATSAARKTTSATRKTASSSARRTASSPARKTASSVESKTKPSAESKTKSSARKTASARSASSS